MGRAKIRKAKIKLSLEKFIEENYSSDDEQVGYLFGLVDEYMSLFDIAAKLKKDIKDRGVNYTAFDGKGNEIIKKNESITDLNRTTQTMIRIQIQLGIKPVSTKGTEENGDLL